MFNNYSHADLRNYKRPSDATLLWYDLTEREHHNMWLAQNGQCAICKVDEYTLAKCLNIDHCHVTGIVRGLLCDNCNNALGLFKDDTERMERALEYVKVARLQADDEFSVHPTVQVSQSPHKKHRRKRS
jgi:hypothetical protein